MLAAQGVTTTGFSYLGLSGKDGVRISIEPNQQDVDTDASGPGPADVQEFPPTATIRFVLSAWATDILDFLMTTPIGSTDWLPGETLPPGLLLGQNGAMKSLRIESPYGEKPWVFPYCHLTGAREVNLGTARSGWNISLRAIVGVGSGYDPGGYESDSNLTKLYLRPAS